MPQKSKNFLCLVCIALLCGCPGRGFRENSLSISANPDGTWDVTAEGVRLDRLITVWAEAAGQDFGSLPPETRDHVIYQSKN